MVLITNVDCCKPKYPIILGAIVCTVALGLISMGMDQNKENLVNGWVKRSRLSKYII